MFNLPFFKEKKEQSNSVGIPILDRSVRLIIGLGNPGEKYKNTFHNVGFMFLDTIETSMCDGDDIGPSSWKSEKNFIYKKINNIIIAKPNTFMNESGRAVKEMIKKFNINPDEMLVVHDDSDIKLGLYKLVYDRGSAGHNGITSINQIIKTNSFLRLRIGIRKNSEKAGKFVLNQMNKNELDRLKKLFLEIKARYFET